MIGLRSSRLANVKKALKLKGFDDFEVRLGDIMRGERATHGKSLMDVQHELKIKAAYIAAVEDADPSVFEPSTLLSAATTRARSGASRTDGPSCTLKRRPSRCLFSPRR
mgnify:CR=1 FL=1